MKKLVLTFIVLFALVLQGFTQAEKTLVKSLETQGNEQVVLALAGDVEVEDWDKDYLRITTNIEVTNFGENILKRLVMLGRYNIESTTSENGKLVISMPKIKNIVTIQGLDLEERLSFKVYKPANTQIEIKDSSITGVF